MPMPNDDQLDVYRSQLRHVVRPESPSEREDANRVQLDDWLALWAAKTLRGYAGYEADTGTESDVATAYAQYIEHAVRTEEKEQVFLYAHTEPAMDVLRAAFDGEGELYTRVRTAVEYDLDVNET